MTGISYSAAVTTLSDSAVLIMTIVVSWWRCCLDHSKNTCDDDDDDDDDDDLLPKFDLGCFPNSENALQHCSQKFGRENVLNIPTCATVPHQNYTRGCVLG